MPTKENKVGLDSAEPITLETTAIIVFLILSPIATKFLESIGSDIYNKAKLKIIDILGKKQKPKIFFQFRSAYKNTTIVIKSETNDKEELNKIFDTIDKARELAISRRVKDELMITVNYNEGWKLESEINAETKVETKQTINKEKLTISEKLNRLNIFEAVVFGIYGNWLISFLDTLNLSNLEIKMWDIPVPYFQALNLIFAFSCLLILFGFILFRTHEVTRKFIIILGIAHLVGIWATILFEEMTIKFSLFYWLGMIIYLVLFLTEIFRLNWTRTK